MRCNDDNRDGSPPPDRPEMTESAAEASEPPGYIRGGAGVAVDAGRVIRVAIGGCLVALAILALALTIGAVHQSARNNRLADHGVAVKVTVTSCLGRATGTGITVNGFTCRGSFALNGRRYDEVISGTTRLYSPGAVLHAVSDPSNPKDLSTARSVPAAKATRRTFALPAVSAAVFIAALACLLWRPRPKAIEGPPYTNELRPNWTYRPRV